MARLPPARGPGRLSARAGRRRSVSRTRTSSPTTPASSNVSRTSPWRVNPTPDRRSRIPPLRHRTFSAGSRPIWSEPAEGEPAPGFARSHASPSTTRRSDRPTPSRNSSRHGGEPMRSGSCCSSRLRPGSASTTQPRPTGSSLAGQSPGPLRAALARHAGADRDTLQRRRTCGLFTPRMAKPRAI